MSRYYHIDPNDPDAPIELQNYNGISVGDSVHYVNAALPPLPEPLVINELVMLDPEAPYVAAILNDGEYEVDAINLVRAEPSDAP